ncbi:Abi-alpha family protein [Rapidithrix thailandica]|uniref:Abi-alpha family protein n=1 Tax=Rapidithrix thailandica TaxID=413964 RepID=A0AAW9SEJ0_9BACT
MEAEATIDFLLNLCSRQVTDEAELTGKHIANWRQQNQLAVLQLAKGMIEQAQIRIKKIPVKTLAAFLNYCSYEEEPSLQNKWATLLVNLVNNDHPSQVSYLFVELLNQLSPLEGAVLDYVYRESFLLDEAENPYFKRLELIQYCQHTFHTTYEDNQLIVENLLRLRLMEEKPATLIKSEDTEDLQLVYSDQLRLSKLGVQLLSVCIEY